MNPKPISEAKDEDLRSSMAALERAAKRARELAEQTGTELIISRKDVELKADQHAEANQLREPSPSYKSNDDGF